MPGHGLCVLDFQCQKYDLMSLKESSDLDARKKTEGWTHLVLVMDEIQRG